MLFERVLVIVALLLAAAGRCSGQAVDLSGAWKLNVQKSTWNNAHHPDSVTLRIRHSEPFLSFEGSVGHAGEEDRPFHFEGAIDGKEYAAQRSYGPGMVWMRRLNSVTVVSTFRSAGGQYIETTEIIIDSQRHTLTQRIHLTTPEGRRNWTEVYERVIDPRHASET